jgi:predicted nucleic acid-binding protein
MALRAVPDTNVVLASEMSSSSTSPNREFFERWRADEFSVLFSEDTLLEYVKKLREKSLPERAIRRLITAILNVGVEVFVEYYHLSVYPIDADDIAFVLWAENGSATHLVTYDRHLLDVDSFFTFSICRTTEFLADLRQHLGSEPDAVPGGNPST